MKRILLLTLTLSLSSLPALLAEEMPDSTKPATPPPASEKGDGIRKHGKPDKPGERMREMAGNLSEAEREQFKAAMQKAKDDPEVVKAREQAEAQHGAMRKAMRDALLRADPTLEPVLAKMRDNFMSGLGRDGGDGRFKKDGKGERHDDVPADARKKLDEAREKANEFPAVTQAKAKLDAAKTPEERSAASKELRAAYRQVILNMDPTLEPYLKDKERGKDGGHGKHHPAPPAPPAEGAPTTTGTT
jgi:hypothetical protein